MKFNELDERTQDKVLEKHYDINVDYQDWHEGVLDYWKEKLEALGIYKPEINYSGFWSQGDGASFTGSIDQWDILTLLSSLKVLKKFRYLVDNIRKDNISLSVTFDRISSHYSHENTCRTNIDWRVESDLVNYDLVATRARELEEYLEDWRRDTCHEIYKSLETEYDYQTSREQIIESLEANEYEFDEEGDII
jgi:hypothetical protein